MQTLDQAREHLLSNLSRPHAPMTHPKLVCDPGCRRMKADHLEWHGRASWDPVASFSGLGQGLASNWRRV